MPAARRYHPQEIATIERNLVIPPYGGRLLQPQDEVLLSRGGGGWTAYDVYSALAKDPHVYAVLQKRYSAVVGREWHVVAGGDRSIDKKAADGVKAMLSALADNAPQEENGSALITTSGGFDQTCLGLLSATLYGHQPAEILWERQGKEIYPVEVPVRDVRRFVYRAGERGYQPRLLTRSYTWDGIEIPPRKFIFHRFAALPTEDPYGLGLGARLFYPVFFKNNCVKFWLIFADKWANPTPIGTHPKTATKEQQEEFLDTLEGIASDAAVRVPEGFKVDFVNAGTGSAPSTYEGLVGFCNGEISKAVLGETGTTDQSSGGGSRARDQVGNEVRIEIAKADADLLCDTLNRTLIKWICQYNWPDAVPPKVWRKFPELESKIDRGAEATLIVALAGAGYKPKREWVEDRLEIELEEEAATEAPGNDLASLLANGLPEDAPAGELATPIEATETPAEPEFGAIIDRVITWQDLKLGVEYLPGQVRFPGKKTSKKLRSGYGHIRGYKGADGEALDCYLAPAFFADGEEPTTKLYEIRQMSMDGDFDEHKFMLGYESQDVAELAYLREMPEDFFGGIRTVTLAELEQYRKPAPVNMSIADADGYGDPIDYRNCANCKFSRTARPDGSGWLNCDKHDFETSADMVCFHWEGQSGEFVEDPDLDGVDEMVDRAGKPIAKTVADWTGQLSEALFQADDLPAFREQLERLYDDLPADAFTATFAEAMLAAELMGRFEVVEEHESAASDVELAETSPLRAEADFAGGHNCTSGKSHKCGTRCIPLTKKCKSPASTETKAVMDHVAATAPKAEAPAGTKPKKPRKKAEPKAPEPTDSIGEIVTKSKTLQEAAAKSSRVADAVQKLRDADEKIGGPVREKIREFVKKNPNALEDIAVSAAAVVGQFTLMPQADVATASLLQGAIGVVTRSGVRAGKRVKEELKADPEALKSGQGILKVSRKVLSDFKGRDLQETLIGDAIGPSVANASGAAVGGGWLGTIVGTVAAVGGAPKAAKAIRQGIQSTGEDRPIEATT